MVQNVHDALPETIYYLINHSEPFKETVVQCVKEDDPNWKAWNAYRTLGIHSVYNLLK